MSAKFWLQREARRARAVVGAATGLALVAGVAGALAVGLVLERLGLFVRMPELIVLPWIGALAAAGAMLWWRRAAHAAVSPAGVGTSLERALHLRTGALAGVAGATHGSPALADLADRRMGAWLDEHAGSVRGVLRRARRRDLTRTATFAAAGVAVLSVAGLGGSRALWRPLAFLQMARAPVRLEVDRAIVARGDSVGVTIEAPGAMHAVLHQRRAGEAWQAGRVTLADGRGRTTVGPVDANLTLVAETGRRHSDTVRVAVRASLFLTDVAVTARYPTYLQQPDEPLAAEGDTVVLPVGSRVELTARASLAVEAAVWQRDGETTPVSVDGAALHGAFVVARSGSWRLVVRGAGGAALEGDPPSLTVVAVPDSAPIVTLPVPGADTVMPTTLIQPLVIEVRDDHRVGRVEVRSRRVSRLGTHGAPIVDSVALPAEGVERAVLTTSLDVNGRGFLPGDTAYVRIRAYDRAPRPHVGETREYRLRFPSLAELRASIRQETRDAQAAADSLADAQRAVGRSVQDLARERLREEQTPTAGTAADRRPRLGFEQVERAGAVGAEQRRVLDRADSLRAQLDRLERSAWEAGLTDPAWHEQLAELRKLLDRALTPELQQALDELQAALDRLDPEAMRNALQRMAAAQEQLRTELERSRALFERAALEGDLTTLSQDAADLAARQAQWNQEVGHAADSTAAREESDMAGRADSLAERLAALETEMRKQGGDSSAAASRRAQAATGHMRRAARAAKNGAHAAAAQAGQQASQQLDPLAETLTGQRDALRDAWRREVLESLDRALVETATLARQQDALARRMSEGESGPEVRAAQGAAREGLDRILSRVQDAAGKNALVAPTVGTALGYARNRMGEALDQLQQGAPNTRAAAEAAGDAVDGLNTLAMQLLRSRGDVAGATSGSGLSEAIERMAQLAQSQGAMAGQAGGMLPLMRTAGQALLQQMRDLARQQRALAQELERMRAQGDLAGTGALAHEAEEIAQRLESGALTRDVVERQERLYRHLLDAGRTLRGPEEDPQKERQSTTARPGNVLLPTGDRPAEAGPRYPYPSWQELQGLSPAERRAVLDYFRALNDARRR